MHRTYAPLSGSPCDVSSASPVGKSSAWSPGEKTNPARGDHVTGMLRFGSLGITFFHCGLHLLDGLFGQLANQVQITLHGRNQLVDLAFVPRGGHDAVGERFYGYAREPSISKYCGSAIL